MVQCPNQGHLADRVRDWSNNLCINVPGRTDSDCGFCCLRWLTNILPKQQMQPKMVIRTNLQECRRRKNQTRGGHSYTVHNICLRSLQYAKAVFMTPPDDCHTDCFVWTSSQWKSSCQDTQKDSCTPSPTLLIQRAVLEYSSSYRCVMMRSRWRQ